MLTFLCRSYQHLQVFRKNDDMNSNQKDFSEMNSSLNFSCHDIGILDRNAYACVEKAKKFKNKEHDFSDLISIKFEIYDSSRLHQPKTKNSVCFRVCNNFFRVSRGRRIQK